MSRYFDPSGPSGDLRAEAEAWGNSPVWMLNLCQFKNPYPGAGRDSYRRYVSGPSLHQHGQS